MSRQHLMARLHPTRLRELLDYDPGTGVFIWRVGRGRVAEGSVAGTINADGYRVIEIDDVKHLAHRLAWLHVTGEWPADEIDHKNCVRDDNWWTNLREANSTQNKRNSRRRRNNTSGLKGVSSRGGGWRAYIWKAGKHCHLGSFSTAAEAHKAYCQAAIEIDADFARFA